MEKFAILKDELAMIYGVSSENITDAMVEKEMGSEHFKYLDSLLINPALPDEYKDNYEDNIEVKN